MLTETERKEIFDLVQNYRKAHSRLADNYRDKRAHDVSERCSRRAGHYLLVMKQALYNAGQNLEDDDIKCFSVLVDSFEQMQRNRFLRDLQKYATFDVVSFVGAYNRSVESKIRIKNKKDVTELSEKDLIRRIDKIGRARKKIKKHRMIFHNISVCDVIQDEAKELAHAVVSGKLKNNSKEYLEVVRRFLSTTIINSVDGDIIDSADKILAEKIQEMDIHTEIEDFVSVQDNKNEPAELEHKLDADVEQSDAEQVEKVQAVSKNDEQTATDKESVKEKINRIRQKIEERKQKEREKIHQWKQRIEQQKAERKQKNREIAQERAKQIDEKKAEREQALREKIEQVRTGIKQNKEAQREAQRAEKLRKEAEQAEQARLKEIEKQERKDRRQERIDNAKKIVSGAADKVAGGFVSVKDKLKSKWQAKKSEIETNKRNREIIRDAERASKEHWKELKHEEKQAEEEKKNLGRFYRNLFAHPSVAPIAALVAVAGMWITFLPTNNNIPVKSDKKNIKTEQAKPVVQKQEVTTVAIDTAYASALVNYYNSALDIIGGAKKDDVLAKLNKQIESGNVKTSDYVSVERIAYAYFMYREYGLKQGVLELAVNGNQKLTDAEQTELINVVMDAGERGQGVQKQAKQKVEARGGGLSQHSKFEHATKQQQRQYLVNRGILQKAHVR